MRRSTRGAALAASTALALLSAAATAQAYQSQDTEICGRRSAPSDQRIASCTTIIQSGRYPPRGVAAAQVDRAQALVDRNDYDGALDDINHALQFNPDDGLALAIRAVIYNHQGAYDRAFADADRAIALRPYDASSYYNRGLASLNRHNYDSAISDFDQAIVRQPDAALGYAARAAAYLGKQDFDHVISDASQAIRFNSNNGQAFRNRGVAYWQKGNFDLALADYDQAILRIPGDPRLRAERDKVLRAKEASAPKPDIPTPRPGPTPPPPSPPAAAPTPKPQPPPALSPKPTPAKPASGLGAEVLARLPALAEYRDLQAAYEQMKGRPGWAAGPEGRAVARQLELARSDAAAITVLKTGVRYRIGGQVLTDEGIRSHDLQTDPDYRKFIVDVLATNVVTAPVDPLAKAARDRYRAGRK